MGMWRAAGFSGKCIDAGSKNLFRCGEASSVGLPAV